MASTYDRGVHDYAPINYPNKEFRALSLIVLKTKSHTWVRGSYMFLPDEEIKQVGDGRSNGYDHQGDCILSVPDSYCTFLTEEEAEQANKTLDQRSPHAH